jgi:mannosyl-oligosaccharide alpha-1,3-glucosidase
VITILIGLQAIKSLWITKFGHSQSKSIAMRLLLVFCLALIATISADPEIIPIRCHESSFCRRSRTVDPNSKFVIDNTTVVKTATGITGEIKNALTGAHLVLKLNCLESNTFHFEIDEKAALRTRYRTQHVVTETPKMMSVNTTVEANRVLVSCDKNEARVMFDPFHIDFTNENGDEVLSVNSNGLMTFEPIRNRPIPPPADGSWDEVYQNYTDSKPNGPEAVAVDFKFHSSDILFGIPEHHDTFALRKTLGQEPYRLYTLDVTFYDLNSTMPNYGAIPVMYGHGAKGTAGIFWHNSADTYVDIHDTENAHFISEGGIMEVFVFLGPKPNDAFSQYTKITGAGGLPQLNKLGFHQSRWNYMSQEETLDVIRNFDKNEIPLDTIWLDIEYTYGKRYFTWNTETFPTPQELQKNITDMGRHLVYIVDPHTKVDESYFYYKTNKDRGYFVKTKDDRDYEGDCWPGLSSYVNYFHDDARSYYADQYLLPDFQSYGVWNDMNEPVVFNVPEKTFPRDLVHIQKDGSRIEHRYLHNMYAFMQTRGTFEGLIKKSNGNIRPFILTRAFFAGNQKYSAVSIF